MREVTGRTPIALSWGAAAWAIWVLACVCAQPFTLGFYVDDWLLCASSARAGAPFSLALFQYFSRLDPSRPVLAPVRYILSSVFRDRTFSWQGGLVVANCAMALVLVWLIREFLGERVSKTGMAVGLSWLLLPWNAALAFWPTCLPALLTLIAFGLLCVYLIRSWDRQRHNAWWVGAIYLALCLSYEAYYFQWIALALIGLTLAHSGRARLRDVLFSSAGLLAAQICAALVHVSIVAPPGASRPIVAGWPGVFVSDLLAVPLSMLRSAWELRYALSVLGRLLIALWAFEAYRSHKMAMLGFSFLVGGVLSIFAFALGGRVVNPTGTDTRTLLLFDYWFVLGAAVLSASALARSGPRMRVAIIAALAALGGTLGVAHVLRSRDWAAAWKMETRILAEAPSAEMENTPPGATIVYVNTLYDYGMPLFIAAWDLDNAMPWKYPNLKGRTFVVFDPGLGALEWDGSKLGYSQIRYRLAETRDVYVWQPLHRNFTRAAGPFRIRPNGNVETN